MKDSKLIELALSIACEAHKGQVDLDKNPVILHPLAVGIAGTNTKEIVVGILHDVVEDSDYTFDYLLKKGIPEDIVECLRILTHSDEDSYEEYLDKIIRSGNETAIKVKMNDLKHNLERGKSGGHTNQVNKHTFGYAKLIPYYHKIVNE